MDDLEKWLESVGCGRHAASFRRNGITLDLLETLTEEDLRELGLNLGDRKRFVRGLSRLADTGELHIAGETSNLRNARIPTAERRRLTVMFIDLVGSTAISSQLDPEEWSDALQNCQDIMAGAVLRFSGHVAQFQGDGAVCLFGWPKALEDAAERSVEAALTVIENMRRFSVRDETINCRIGIATGLVVIGDSGGRAMSQDNTAIGETVNFAARLQ